MNSTHPVSDDEIDDRLEILMNPFGDPFHQREHEAALQWLLERPVRAHARMLERIGAGPVPNLPALLEVLPRFARDESVPVLEGFLAAADPICHVAARALAGHPAASAMDALVRALRSPHRRTAVAAADGLMVRGDSTVCPHLRALIDHRDEIVRFHLIQAAGTLRCLNDETLADLERHDDFAEIRTLAGRLRREPPDPEPAMEDG